MLAQLSIKNFALIDDILVDFEPSFNVLTGETGAGKSILIDALKLVLGERFESHFIRDQSASCLVEAVFVLGDRACPDFLMSYRSDGDECLVLKREITPEMRSKCSINGRMTNLSVLREAGDALINIHGQNDHQAILSKNLHGAILDQWLEASKNAKAFQSALASYRELFSVYHELTRKKQQMIEAEQGREREIDLLRYQVDEIGSVMPEAGELVPLKEELTRLTHAERLQELTQTVFDHLEGDEGGVSAKMTGAFRDVRDLLKIDPSFSGHEAELEKAQIHLEEFLHELRNYHEKLSCDADRLKEAEDRVEALEKLKRKYGTSKDMDLADVILFYENAKERLDYLENAGVYRKEIEGEIAKILPGQKEIAAKISKLRQAGAEQLRTLIEKELKELGFKNASFCCRIDTGDFKDSGQDEVEFLISPNAGEPLRPLVDIASGGEASRTMLALKRILARADSVPTLIFDEIDANIGGRLGTVVGEKIKSIAEERQVLLITHLPQIASYATRHLKVIKSVDEGKTQVRYRVLTGKERIQELAQMMSGENETKISVTHAEEMLKTAGSKA